MRIALTVIVPTTVLLAVAVDLAALTAWLTEKMRTTE
jgi:hypothetical protein